MKGKHLPCLLWLGSWLLVVVSVFMPFKAQAGNDTLHLFSAGEGGYHTYRIPAIVTTVKGTLLAFCEGRKDGPHDAGNIDIVLKRSTDGGRTWSKVMVIWSDSTNTCGNPCPVVDGVTGAIWLLMTHNLGSDKEGDLIRRTAQSSRTVWAAKSEDDGLGWSVPVNVTNSAKDTSWGWYATGPGIGIQVQYGPYKGRLIVPCDHGYADANGRLKGGYEYGAHVIYSDDHGVTWQKGGVIRPKVNECQVTELADGKGGLLMNMRSYFGHGCRTHAVSHDGGGNWSAPEDVSGLEDPVCQASIIRYTWPVKKHAGCLLFLNPASKNKRDNMTLKASTDEGRMWRQVQLLYAGPSAYSCMALLPHGEVVCLYEAGEREPYEVIVLQRIDKKTITRIVKNRG
ncbi:sialidase family protein [Chitinophaga ginsengisoli]|uniref:exo-alpha-sialidase n=1 Tax=Chitinophaga ginsengisoli TaxID=363837 RepID=A0A2P8GE41_9BACT|nr:sialidase family protein [Chitinophaga ginsengisoli]PSL32244.1 sialidase-1 [Chitinophaga ginsengisoli]